jgi:hypothetical protein
MKLPRRLFERDQKDRLEKPKPVRRRRHRLIEPRKQLGNAPSTNRSKAKNAKRKAAKKARRRNRK